MVKLHGFTTLNPTFGFCKAYQTGSQNEFTIAATGSTLQGGETVTWTLEEAPFGSTSWSDITSGATIGSNTLTSQVLDAGDGHWYRISRAVTNSCGFDCSASDILSVGPSDCHFDNIAGDLRSAMVQDSGEEHIYPAVFPNPSGDAFRVTGKFNAEIPVSVRVYNAQGAIILDKRISGFNNNGESLDLSRQPAGAYVIALSQGRLVETVRVVKQ
jgi:hypothetical protein